MNDAEWHIPHNLYDSYVACWMGFIYHSSYLLCSTWRNAGWNLLTTPCIFFTGHGEC